MKRVLKNTLLALNQREQRRLIWLALADVIISVLDIAVLALLLLQINYYTQPGSIVNLYWPNLWFTGNMLAGLLLLLSLFIAKNMAAYFIYRAKYHFAYNVAARLSENNLLQYMEGNYSDYVNKDSAVHIRRISQQPVEFCHYVLAGFQQLFSESVMIVLAAIAIILFDASLFLLLCLVLLPPLVLLSFYIKRRLGTVRANIKTGSEKALQHLKEALSGYIESNIYSTNKFFTDRYGGKQHTLNQYLAELQSMQVLPSRLMEIFAILGLLSLVAINELVPGTPMISIFTIGAFLAAAYKIIPSLVKILNIRGQVKTYAFTAEDLVPPQTEKDIPAARPASIHSLEFRQVSFHYNDRQVLEKFDLTVGKGELVGLTGISGKGKTTLFNLLLGFLEPDTGNILLNNNAATADARQLLWKNTSYVKQQPFVVHDSILTNITLNDKQYDEQQLQQAIQASGLDALIKQLPQGLNTIIAENGKNISGGQRQRIALARAFYKNADLLLLDEPFNELDEASEQRILQHLHCLTKQGKLIILITHNKKSLSFCNKTISMDAT